MRCIANEVYNTLKKKKSRPKVSEALIELRRRLDHTQESLARSLNVSLQTVALWETKRPPTGIVLTRLEQLALRYDYADLAEVFDHALQAGPRRSREDIAVERARWEEIDLSLGELVTIGQMVGG